MNRHSTRINRPSWRTVSRNGLFASFTVLVVALGLIPAAADPRVSPDRQISHGSRVGPDDGAAKNHHQHGPTSGHLPASVENMELVGKKKLTNTHEDISDVSALQAASNGKWYAYVGDWGGKCTTGGVHMVDISNPANPTKVGWIKSPGTGYKTEGIQALRITTSQYTGDILVTSNEWCKESTPHNMPGGISIHNINAPASGAKVLAQAVGDTDVHGNRANEAHSAIAWDAGDNAYVAAIDNEELEDVDIFDITDPRNPVLISETDLPGVNVNAWGSEKTSHDFDVHKRGNEWHLMVSDWDAGWIDVNVTDPHNPAIVGDFDYAACDQAIAAELGKCLQPEGNAHQGEWNGDSSLFIGTDEDFSPYRLTFQTTSGPLAGQYFDAGEFGWTKPIASFPDGEINGPTVFGGYGCPGDTAGVPHASTLTADPGEEKVIVFQRGPVDDPSKSYGACFFSDKVRAGEDLGYDVVIVANHHAGAGGGASPNAFTCGSQGSPTLGTAAGLCVGHRWMHLAFGTAENYDLPYSGTNEPAVGTLGPDVFATTDLDGWGYVRLIDTSNPAAPVEVDQLTIDETIDADTASGFGDISVHEVEVPRGDPAEGGTNPDDGQLAYFSWYSAGMRVARFGPAGIEEVGHIIEPGGANFWGVALAEDADGNRLILGSDMDYGLRIYRYTGEI